MDIQVSSDISSYTLHTNHKIIELHPPSNHCNVVIYMMSEFYIEKTYKSMPSDSNKRQKTMSVSPAKQPIFIYKHISCIYTPITLVRSTCRNRPKLMICSITFLFIISTFQLECDSYRELHNATNNTVTLCVKNKKTKFGGYSTIIQFIPSWFFVEQTIRRFLGDTFLFDDQHTIPQLDWRTAVLDITRIFQGMT